MLTRTDTYNDAVSFTYDDAGNQLSVTDAKSTSQEYDVLGRLVKKTDRLSGETGAIPLTCRILGKFRANFVEG